MAVLVPRETPKTWRLQEVLVTEPGTGSPPSAVSHDEAVRLIDRQRRAA